MNTKPNLALKFLGGSLLLCGFALAAANLPSDWQHTQSFEITKPGLVKVSLPAATLDTARPALEDLRLCDDAGNELPFLIERPLPAGKIVQPAKSFQVSLNATATVITIETGLAKPLDGLTLESPAQNFIKPVRAEYSEDGKTWRTLVQGQPLFRQPSGVGNLKISFPPTAAKWLRVTVDDQRSQPVPFTGARVHAASAEATPVELQTVAISERNENPGETRLVLNLGAADLDVAAVRIETDEPLFTRHVTVAVPQILENGTIEKSIGHGVIFRVAVDGQPSSANLTVPLEQHIGSRELVLSIRNDDSPPLPVRAVSIEWRPVYLVFMAREAGTFHLLTGNKTCAAPRYDLASLGGDLKNAALTPTTITAPADNPGYHAPEALAELELTGAPLDIAPWKCRKPIPLSRSGVQQIELDLDVLAHAQPGFTDLRVMLGTNQVPYLLQRTSISRPLPLSITATNDPKRPAMSRWIIKLPQSNLPIFRLTCRTTSTLFQRTLFLSEERTDVRGGKYVYPLGSALWTQTPERKSKEFTLPLDTTALGDTLILETDNGDNPPIELEEFTAFYPATRLLFKAQPDDHLYLYYGNPRAGGPSYDLSLAADELLSADKIPATPGVEETLKKPTWAESQVPGQGGFIFWGILALVVVGLLVVISRLLPKAPAA